MLKGQNIICISSIDWDFIWQGHQEIMKTFADNGNRVLFIENTGVRPPTIKDLPRLKRRISSWLHSAKGFRSIGENLFIYSPLILPFPYSRIAGWFNRKLLIDSVMRWMKIMKFYDPIIWTFLPTRVSLDMINAIDHRLLIYYCIADFYELTHNPKKVKKVEDELIRRCDMVFAQGPVLYSKCKGLNDNVHIFPFGVKFDIFENFRSFPETIPLEIKNIRKPILGYIGGIHRHIDFELIKYIAARHPEWSIVFVGPVQTDVSMISGICNVFFTGKKDFSQLPSYLHNFDVCIIPYKKTNYTLTVFPTKLNEYHAMGRPVVSTDLPELVNFNRYNDDLVYLACNHEEFERKISTALNENNIALEEQRVCVSKKNSWSKRIGEMSLLIEDKIKQKEAAPWDWKRNFLTFCNGKRTKLIKGVSLGICVYLLIFHSPALWFLASPLEISEKPSKADAIVVFAGGVGESGKAGQGYEERVKYAVELYNESLGRYLIFSSGYSCVFKESALMKALAVSLGVPENAIILEDKAGNTYENVMFSKTILDGLGLNSIILVSSPYHMRRAKLTFKKNAPRINVLYTPIPESLFYQYRVNKYLGFLPIGVIRVDQIRGIIHEYAGIVYYWFKGWI